MNYSQEKSLSIEVIIENPPEELTSIFSILETLMLRDDLLFLYIICFYKCPS